eukprot:CAMPEP_0117684714 /NCGR_PEP_ID=MMETSP0804-20121206/21275_1 /TAXON_ID=1074897 /ORGANISM="Tetraselmis astigmatica, Strain CCMP880" /LENGTH=63 /DNA_ID=CAMNT_0005495781 /DNA_START=539 /DNA_END=730 /DNA_ORIENTATION=-
MAALWMEQFIATPELTPPRPLDMEMLPMLTSELPSPAKTGAAIPTPSCSPNGLMPSWRMNCDP